MPLLTTSMMPVLSSKSNTGNGIFNPLSAPLNSTPWKTLRASLCVEGDSGVSARLGVRTSPDGLTWGNALVAPNDATFATGSGWRAPTAWFNLADITSIDDYPFFQLGASLRNASADGKVKNAHMCLRIEGTEVGPQTIVTPLVMLATLGSTSTDNFIPLTATLDARSSRAARAAAELRVSTGAVKVRIGVQQSDDGETWDTPIPLSGYTSYITSEGVAVGKTFTDLTGITKRFVRFGALAANTSGSDIEAALMALRLDLRSA